MKATGRRATSARGKKSKKRTRSDAMERGNHWLAAVGVLAAGFGSAMFFHEEGTSPAPTALAAPGDNLGTDLPWTGEPLTLRMSGEQPPVDSSMPAVAPRTTLTRTPESDAPPDIESEYGGLLHQFGGKRETDISNWPAPAPTSKPTRLAIAPSNSASTDSASAQTPPPPASINPTPANTALSPVPGRAELDTFALGTIPAETARVAGPLAASVPLPRSSSSVSALKPQVDNRNESPDGSEAAEPRPRRQHVIRDGDTLAKLALRYYGDEAWAVRIYAANREALRDPELLPVGKSLVLPTGAESVGDQPLAPLTQPPALVPAPPKPTAPAPVDAGGEPPAASQPAAAQTQLAPLG